MSLSRHKPQLIVVGHAGAGKTTLMRTLRDLGVRSLDVDEAKELCDKAQLKALRQNGDWDGHNTIFWAAAAALLDRDQPTVFATHGFASVEALFDDAILTVPILVLTVGDTELKRRLITDGERLELAQKNKLGLLRSLGPVLLAPHRRILYLEDASIQTSVNLARMLLAN